jgi:methylmalonyl-CoA mutase cobalamin-binding subunit
VDTGIDQPTINTIETAEKNKADIIALSSVMTTTMPYQKEVIDTLVQMKIRDNYSVLVGGVRSIKSGPMRLEPTVMDKDGVEAIEDWIRRSFKVFPGGSLGVLKNTTGLH